MQPRAAAAEAAVPSQAGCRRASSPRSGVGEWGDITQIVTANYAARYRDPLSVAVGAVLGLWAVAAFAITAGSKLLQWVSVSVVRRVTGTILLGFGVASAYTALRG